MSHPFRPVPEGTSPTESDAVRENRHALYRKIDKIEQMCSDVHLALVGNSLGNIGLVKRVEIMEAKVDGHDRKLWFGLTLLSAIWAGIVAFKERIFH